MSCGKLLLKKNNYSSVTINFFKTVNGEKVPATEFIGRKFSVAIKYNDDDLNDDSRAIIEKTGTISVLPLTITFEPTDTADITAGQYVADFRFSESDDSRPFNSERYNVEVYDIVTKSI